MRYKRFGNTVYIRLETSENILETLQEICRKEKIYLGTVEGFGGVSYLKMGIWNNGANQYDYMEAENRSMEILNLSGNISMQDNSPVLHVHVTAADYKFHVFGGHLVKGIVKNLAEITIHADEGSVNRIPVGYWHFMDL